MNLNDQKGIPQDWYIMKKKNTSIRSGRVSKSGIIPVGVKLWEGFVDLSV